MSRIIRCNVCFDGESFAVPEDSVGIVLMFAHFEDKHPELAVEWMAQYRKSKGEDDG